MKNAQEQMTNAKVKFEAYKSESITLFKMRKQRELLKMLDAIKAAADDILKKDVREFYDIARTLNNEANDMRNFILFGTKTRDYDYTKAERQARFRARKKAEEQRKNYAAKRCSKAIDRVIVASDAEAKNRAAEWAKLWARVAGYTR